MFNSYNTSVSFISISFVSNLTFLLSVNMKSTMKITK